MRVTSSAGRLLVGAGLAAVLLVGGGTPAAGTGSTSSYARLHPLSSLSAQRLATADLVAAAKYGTGAPVDDPARERQVLEAVARQAAAAGADPAAAVRIFRDQIEANKFVQRALHRAWDADPSTAPAGRPDLAVVREEINRLNGELVRAVAASAPARNAPSCRGVLAATTAHVRHARHLDAPHTVALVRATRTVCD